MSYNNSAIYWIILGSYLGFGGVALYFFLRRRNCFSCTIPVAICRSLVFAAIVTPSVIPTWVLVPVPASLLLLMLIWSAAFEVNVPAAIPLQAATLLVLLPTLATATLTFFAWLWLRRRRYGVPFARTFEIR